MLYWLLYPLREHFFAFNVFRYITFRAAYAMVTALLICFVFGPLLIRALRKLQIGQRIRNEAPDSHQRKEGTPTMGGVLIIAATVVPTLLWGNLANPYIQVALVVTLWTGLIGFLDDYLRVVKKTEKGLVGRYKLLGQFVFGAALGVFLYMHPLVREGATESAVPFLKNYSIEWGLLYIPFVIFVIMGASNAVNLTDGLDGLAAGASAFSFFAFAALAYISGHRTFAGYLNIPYMPGCGELTVYCLAMVGASLGFLWYNTHPAADLHGGYGIPLARRGARHGGGAAQAGAPPRHHRRHLRRRGAVRDPAGRIVQADGEADIQHGSHPPPFRAQGVARRKKWSCGSGSSRRCSRS